MLCNLLRRMKAMLHPLLGSVFASCVVLSGAATVPLHAQGPPAVSIETGAVHTPAPHSPAQGSAANSVTRVRQEYVGRFTHLRRDEAIVVLGVRSPGHEFLAVGIGVGGHIKDGDAVASSINPEDPKDCAICYLGEAGDESIIAVVTNRIPLRIGAGIWLRKGLSPGVVISKGVELSQLERGRVHLLGRLTTDGAGVTWEAEPNLRGLMRQLLAGSAPALLASPRNLQPSKPVLLEQLQGRVARSLTSRGEVLVFNARE
jgi:hypothetical protein